jgi:RNA polymerase sigma factor (sigma-70 family)
MSCDTLNLSHDTLHEELLPRVAQLRQYVHRKIPDRLRAAISPDDVLQEVWMAAYQAVSSFTPDGPGAVERWLMTITNSKVADAIKAERRMKRGGDRYHVRAARERSKSLADLFTRIRSPERTPSGEFGTSEAAQAISIALNALSSDRRRAICMYHIEGRSYRDIARELDKSETTVRGLLYHGRRELRSLLGDAARFFSDVGASEADDLDEAAQD